MVTRNPFALGRHRVVAKGAVRTSRQQVSFLVRLNEIELLLFSLFSGELRMNTPTGEVVGRTCVQRARMDEGICSSPSRDKNKPSPFSPAI
jgi:hypothetical protein